MILEIYLNNCLVSWGSRQQKLVPLSYTKSEYVAASEVCREIMFLKNILEFVGFKVQFPFNLLVDNIGAILLVRNDGGKGSRHVDIKYHYVR